jgi:hypothetical protein
MGQDQKIGFGFIHVIYLPDISIHDGADTLTGCKEKLCQVYFSKYILFSNRFSVLVGKTEWADTTLNRHFNVAETRDKPGHYQIKADRNGSKKSDVIKKPFTHKNWIGAKLQRKGSNESTFN